MSNDQNWIHEIIPKTQVDAINRTGEALVHNMTNGLTIMLNATNQSAIELCRAWKKTKEGNEEGFESIAYFINGFIESLETYLEEEDINPYKE
jgi:hypothetical protein